MTCRGDKQLLQKISTVLHQFEASDHGMWGTASNFPAFCKVVHAFFPNPKLADEVNYEDMTLRDPDSGTKVFESLKQLEQIRYYVGQTN